MKFLKYFMVFILGLILGVGTIVGGGYLIATQVRMGFITEKVDPQGNIFGESIKDISALDTVKALTSKDATVATYMDYFPAIEKGLNDLKNGELGKFVAIDIDEMKEYKISEISANIGNCVYVTASLQSLKDQFHFEIPDLPIINSLESKVKITNDSFEIKNKYYKQEEQLPYIYYFDEGINDYVTAYIGQTLKDEAVGKDLYFSGIIKDMPVTDGITALSKNMSFNTLTFGEIEEKFGVNIFPSDPDAIINKVIDRDWKINELSDRMADMDFVELFFADANLHTMETQFNFDLPDLPVINEAINRVKITDDEFNIVHETYYGERKEQICYHDETTDTDIMAYDEYGNLVPEAEGKDLYFMGTVAEMYLTDGLRALFNTMDLDNLTFGEIEDKFGMHIFPDDPDALINKVIDRTWKISELSERLADLDVVGLFLEDTSLNSLQEDFNFELPDLPIINEVESKVKITNDSFEIEHEYYEGKKDQIFYYNGEYEEYMHAYIGDTLVIEAQGVDLYFIGTIGDMHVTDGLNELFGIMDFNNLTLGEIEEKFGVSIFTDNPDDLINKVLKREWKINELTERIGEIDIVELFLEDTSLNSLQEDFNFELPDLPIINEIESRVKITDDSFEIIHKYYEGKKEQIVYYNDVYEEYLPAYEGEELLPDAWGKDLYFVGTIENMHVSDGLNELFDCMDFVNLTFGEIEEKFGVHIFPDDPESLVNKILNRDWTVGELSERLADLDIVGIFLEDASLNSLQGDFGFELPNLPIIKTIDSKVVITDEFYNIKYPKYYEGKKDQIYYYDEVNEEYREAYLEGDLVIDAYDKDLYFIGTIEDMHVTDGLNELFDSMDFANLTFGEIEEKFGIEIFTDDPEDLINKILKRDWKISELSQRVNEIYILDIYTDPTPVVQDIGYKHNEDGSIMLDEDENPIKTNFVDFYSEIDYIRLTSVITADSVSGNKLLETILAKDITFKNLASTLNEITVQEIFEPEVFDTTGSGKVMKFRREENDGVVSYVKDDDGDYMINPDSGIWLFLVFNKTIIGNRNDFANLQIIYTERSVKVQELDKYMKGENNVGVTFKNALLIELYEVGVLSNQPNPAFYGRTINDMIV